MRKNHPRVKKRCASSVSLIHLFPTRPQEEFYTEGSLELLQARRRLAEYSLPRLDFTNRRYQ